MFLNCFTVATSFFTKVNIKKYNSKKTNNQSLMKKTNWLYKIKQQLFLSLSVIF